MRKKIKIKKMETLTPKKSPTKGIEPKNRKAIREYEYRLQLINDDIQVAIKTKDNLTKSNQLLNEQIEEEQFKLEELRAKQFENDNEENQEKSEIQKEQGNEELNQTQEKTFFGNLGNLEAWEAQLRAQMEQIKKQGQTMTHDYTVQFQRRSTLRRQIESARENIIIQKDQCTKFESDLAVADQEYVTQDEHLTELRESYFNLQQEYETRLAEFKQCDDTIKQKLEEEKKPLIEEHNQLTQNLEVLQRRFDQMQEEEEKRRKETERQHQQQTSVSSWLAYRSILLDKMKKKRIQMAKEQNSLTKELHALEEINRQYKALFGNDDPGDGTGNLAKAMVQAEIDANAEKNKESKAETNAASQELEIEREYKQQLDDTLSQLEKSFALFEDHKNAVFGALDEEIEECEQDGFLALLQSEKDELMVKYSKY